ncbi:MAG: NAD(P)-dependent oxidoreductase, partial [Candidatus Staskawiczbacteria bacterium]|nr:NAD(P)-dependent oxidoreductase [Candidatus Staskawiczbacteria bacterium]
ANMENTEKILITGACGYLGANIANVLAENGYKVTAFDVAMPKSNPQWEKKMDNIIIGDIRDTKIFNKLAKNDFSAIIHLISLDHRASQGDPDEVTRINVLPVWNLLNIFKDEKLKTFIYFSTQQVVGKLPKTLINENAEVCPLNHYGLTHLLGEQIVSYYDRISDINCINIRLSNGFGPPIFKENNCWWLVVNDLCKIAFEKGKIVLLSDGTPQRDFIYVKDIGLAVKTILEKNDISVKTVNVGSGSTYTILELAHLVRKVYNLIFGKDIEIILGDGTVSKELSSSQIEKFSWDTNKLKKLDFLPETSIESGIGEIFKYLQNTK